MKKDKLFTTYFNKRCKSILTHLEQFHNSFNAEDLHHIRVEIKKLKALFYLQKNYGGYEIPVVHKKVFLGLFRQAGSIRDKQEELKLAQQYNVTAENWEKKRINEINILSRKLAQNTFKYANALSVIQIKTAKSLITISPTNINRFFQEQIKKIKQHFKQRNIFPLLHKNRKLLKRILYINNLLPANQKNQEIDFKYADKLQKLIGQWHDVIATIYLLEQPAFSTNIAPLHLRRKKLEKNILTIVEKFNDKVQLH